MNRKMLEVVGETETGEPLLRFPEDVALHIRPDGTLVIQDPDHPEAFVSVDRFWYGDRQYSFSELATSSVPPDDPRWSSWKNHGVNYRHAFDEETIDFF